MSARQFIFSSNEAARANFEWAGSGPLVFCRLLSLAWVLVLGTFVSLQGLAAVEKLPPASTITVDFTSQIEPVFRQHCYACHGAEKQKNNFRLDLKTAALKGGDDYAPDIGPGNSAGSPLVQFVAG